MRCLNERVRRASARVADLGFGFARLWPRELTDRCPQQRVPKWRRRRDLYTRGDLQVVRDSPIAS